MTIVYSMFNKIELAKWFQMTGVAKLADDAVNLLNLNDRMDVPKMVTYLHLVAAVGNTAYDFLPQAYHDTPGSLGVLESIWLNGELTGNLVALIVRHKVGVGVNGAHMPVT